MNLTYENCITLLVLINDRMTKLGELADLKGPVQEHWLKRIEELEFISKEIRKLANELDDNPVRPF